MLDSAPSLHRNESWHAAILGGGPCGLLAALAAARRGPTQLLLQSRHRIGTALTRIDTVPAPFLALLLEFGIHPAELDIHQLHDVRSTSWHSETVESNRGLATAHIERPLLEKALLARVCATPAIDIRWVDRLIDFPQAALVLDATGRRAVTAAGVTAAKQPWNARIFCTEVAGASVDRTFRICSLPGGYVYRVGSQRHLMLGWVGPSLAGSGEDLEALLYRQRAEWMLEGMPRLRSMFAGQGGPASVQWAHASTSAIPIGDAALARDVLSAYGIAAGTGDSIRLAGGELQPGAPWHDRVAEQRRSHLASLRALVDRCRYSTSDAWATYAMFLSQAR